MFLWLWDWVFWKRDQDGKVKLTDSAKDTSLIGGIIWYITFLLAFSTSFFTGIFGTSKLSGAKISRARLNVFSIHSYGTLQELPLLFARKCSTG
jgi:hypothetical protein